MDHSAEDKTGGIDCRNCCHFQVTWDPGFPRGCRAMGFKTSQWPCMEVLRSSGEPCLKFQVKVRQEQSQLRGAREVDVPSGRFSRKV
ncbi:MAG: hypothetical protein HQL87_06915 [Magnetococcales bacterium]|nr:hypothetical protein [Magnetococcales bacterium]